MYNLAKGQKMFVYICLVKENRKYMVEVNNTVEKA